MGMNVAMVSALAFRNYDPGSSSYLASQLWLCFSTTMTRCCGAGFTQHDGAVKVLTEGLCHLCRKGTAWPFL